MSLLKKITINTDICFGKPTVKGLKCPVEMLLNLLSSGMAEKEIILDYPDLEKEDILACLEYASKLVQVKNIQ